MKRSKKGLAGAGEEKLLPEFAGRRGLDLGCGYGWHCANAAQKGAASVLGVDLLEKMLKTAREKNSGPVIQYRRAAMEDLTFAPGSFDVVLSSLAFHCVRDFAPLVEPRPPQEMMDLPGMRDELRRPMMLLVAAQKQ